MGGFNDFKAEGIGSFPGGTFGKLDIDGICKCAGDIKAGEVTIDGTFKSKGGLVTGLLDCNGIAEFEGGIRADKIDVDGILNVTEKGRVEAEEIVCDGMITAGEISADVVRADGLLNAGEIVGDRIRIRTKLGPVSRAWTRKWSNVGMIEATDVELYGVVARTVSGKNVRIGAKCEIGTVDCGGELVIDPKAKVEKVTGEYVRKEI